ncbi:MAG TPA: translation initiation factor IF-2 [Candidatus Eisenbacteria bacterium]|jgi:translation initiation factor IF-2|nr:translation initiation factor IF-2 [Candidatus Eisenbacteria bacterium]
MPAAKRRVYEAAKDMGMSSEALVSILKSLQVEVKSHMSSIDESVVEQVRLKLSREKEAVKEEEARKREKAIQAAKAAADAQRRTAPAPGLAGLRGGKPAKKKKRAVDEKLIRASVRRTMAEMEGTRRRRHHHKTEEGAAVGVEEAPRVIRVSEFISVAELAGHLEVKPQEVIAVCMQLGIMANINRRLDKDSIQAVADEFGFEVEFVSELGEEVEEAEVESAEGLTARPPVVTIMGHVDHGKTSLLDYIRKTNVIAGEAGGITQHIGAYEVELPSHDRITFLDTPGHEAFTAMRARGAQVTDIVVLVVAADDRVMPQTVEAIDHARAANVPMIVAINKIDLPDANIEMVRQDLSKHNLLVEEWGGKTIAVPISAKKGTNVEKLLEMILLQSELLELKADASKHARGVVIESRVEQGRGIIASVLVQKGTLRVGDAFVAGSTSGKVRAMLNERGSRAETAGPSTPVEVLGWSSPPQAGDTFVVMEDEREARELASKRGQLQREQEHRLFKHVTLTDLYSQIKAGKVSDLLVVLKGDVDGSVEALEDSLTKLSTDEVKLRVIHRGVGQITESDVLLAAASNAVIIGFHVKPDQRAAELASKEKVDVRLYDIIYEAVADVKDAMSGLLTPEIRETATGSAEVRQVFRTTKSGVIAGCMVLSGNIQRSARARLVREGQVVWDGKIASLRRFKDDVREVASGYECGIGLEGRDDIREKDLIESYVLEEVARRLS